MGGVTALFATEAIKPASRGLFHSCPSGTAGSQHSKGDTKYPRSQALGQRQLLFSYSLYRRLCLWVSPWSVQPSTHSVGMRQHFTLRVRTSLHSSGTVKAYPYIQL